MPIFCATLPIFFFCFCFSKPLVNKIYPTAFWGIFRPLQKADNLCKFCTNSTQNFLQSHKKYFLTFFDFFAQSDQNFQIYSIYFQLLLIFLFLFFIGILSFLILPFTKKPLFRHQKNRKQKSFTSAANPSLPQTPTAKSKKLQKILPRSLFVLIFYKYYFSLLC